MPAPKKGESQDKYIQRCMSDSEMNSKHPDQKQRYAICMSMFKSKAYFDQILNNKEDKIE